MDGVRGAFWSMMAFAALDGAKSVMSETPEGLNSSNATFKSKDEAVEWLSDNYPELTTDVNVRFLGRVTSLLMGLSGHDGVAPGGDTVYISDIYKGNNLPESIRADMFTTTTHELLHQYVSNLMGGVTNYIGKNIASSGEIHSWITTKATQIRFYQENRGSLMARKRPSITLPDNF